MSKVWVFSISSSVYFQSFTNPSLAADKSNPLFVATKELTNDSWALIVLVSSLSSNRYRCPSAVPATGRKLGVPNSPPVFKNTALKKAWSFPFLPTMAFLKVMFLPPVSICQKYTCFKPTCMSFSPGQKASPRTFRNPPWLRRA